MDSRLIYSPLEHYAYTTPDAPALSYSGKRMSYRELHERSNQLANALLKDGVKREDRIGIFLHKGLELGIAIYGILKAGCAFVPLDPFMPADRLSFIVDDCNIKFLISSDSLTPTLLELHKKNTSLHVIGVSEDLPFTQKSWPEISQSEPDNPNIDIIDQHLAYIMYTSGSTGVPKGMMHTHASSNCYADWGKHHVALEANDNVASHAPLHFDLSIFDFFSTLRAGATVVLVPESVTRFPASWTEYIESEQISVVFTVPYTLITMVEQGAMDKRNLKSLRWILFGGEPYATRQLKQLINALPDVRLTNVYGPAEAPSCTCYDIPRPYSDNNEPLPIGHVSRNSASLIVDDSDKECEIGEAGELCIRSSTLTRGYWNRPDLNANAFLQIDGLSHFPDVYFRTGDRVVLENDGLLRFLGRKDRMIKTRGHRVELDEVEAALLGIEGVLEGAAYVIPDTIGSVQIMADVTVNPEHPLDNNIILGNLRDRLPSYAIPRSLRVAATLPHTSSGKVDRNALIELHAKATTKNLNQ